ncbi:MAG: 4-(cytidine 5'-diphospho)-2-C-methyl-D-erythritol kinase [Candidatus Desantisbacteria bacterium]
MIEIYAPAKLNLYLDVIDKRADGYHNIVSIMQTIGLYDVIQIEEAKELSLECPALNLPSESNIAYKAALLLREYTDKYQGASIKIDKHIPQGAGLGGGSSDAASVLIGLNQLWELGLNKQELMQIGEKLGADVPFFIIGGTCLAEGIGTKITGLPDLCNIWFVIVYPKINISTAWVYKNLKFKLTNEAKTVKIISSGIKNNDITTICEGLYNGLEAVTLNHYPQISVIKNELKNAGCLAALMSGSGSCVFGITGTKEEAENVVCKLKGRHIGLPLPDEWDMFIVSSGG